jgi:murein DD-endopeptidase MepM/ murein hydrolase activator NlpD
MDQSLRRIYLSVASILSVLWFGMVTWIFSEIKPEFIGLKFLSPDKYETSSSRDTLLPLNAAGFRFFTYRTTPGETFLSVAQKFHIKEESLRSLNQANDDGESARLDSILYIPSKDAIFHRVLPGQKLSDISKAYGVSLMEILLKNHKKGDFDLQPGEIIYLPGAKYLPRQDVRWVSLMNIRNRNNFQKPTTGRFADGFGKRVHPITGKEEFHAGLDLAPGFGARVLASQEGRVTFANIRAGYGRLIILSHGDALTSWYAHLDEILVKPKQFVKKGEVIGKVGNTGRVTGPHLHFEMRLNDKPQNPLLYLGE